jgi:hypothetical protein
MEDGYYQVIPSAWSGAWVGGEGLLFQGPYDAVNKGDGVEYVPSHVKAVAVLTDSGCYDFLMKTGVCFRPLLQGHLPLFYYGAYKGPEHKYFANKGGRFGVQKCYRAEEGAGMRWSLNLDDYGDLVKELKACGYRGVSLVKKLEKKLGFGVGVEFGSVEITTLKA